MYSLNVANAIQYIIINAMTTIQYNVINTFYYNTMRAEIQSIIIRNTANVWNTIQWPICNINVMSVSHNTIIY